MEFVGKMSAKARKKSMKKSKEIERDFEKAIAALKSSLVIQKLVKIMTDQGEDAAAECLKEVNLGYVFAVKDPTLTVVGFIFF